MLNASRRALQRRGLLRASESTSSRARGAAHRHQGMYSTRRECCFVVGGQQQCKSSTYGSIIVAVPLFCMSLFVVPHRTGTQRAPCDVALWRTGAVGSTRLASPETVTYCTRGWMAVVALCARDLLKVLPLEMHFLVDSSALHSIAIRTRRKKKIIV